MKSTPMQELKTRFESKEKLVAELIPLLEDKREDKKALKQKLLHVSNAKLLQLYDVAQKVNQTFSSKKSLIDAIMDKKFAGMKHDDVYRDKISEYSVKKLFDLFNQVSSSAKKKN